MANPKIRVIGENEHDQSADPESSLAEAVAEIDTTAMPRISTKTLIIDVKEGLIRTIGGLRQHVSNLETEMAQANADYEQTVAAAKLLRDDTLAILRADMFQVNGTIAALEPARTKLAERSS